jgi:hypothetical protein
VGDIGQNNGLDGYGGDVNGAIKTFEKKFKDKSANNWSDRENFVARSSKYTLIEMDTGAEEEEIPPAATPAGKTPVVGIKSLFAYSKINISEQIFVLI